MVTLTAKIEKQQVTVEADRAALVAGSEGLYQLALEYDQEWDDISLRMVVFDGAARRAVYESDGMVVIPSETLAHPCRLSVGVIGYDSEGKVKIVTRSIPYRERILVSIGGASDQDVAQDGGERSPTLWEELASAVGDLSELETENKENLVAAINEALSRIESPNDGVSCTHSWEGTVLTVTSASGTTSADLQGEPGPQGPQGATGTAGAAGADGVSPTIEVSKEGKVTTLTITDVNGTKTAFIQDGSEADTDGADWAENDEESAGYVKNRTHWAQVISEEGVVCETTSVVFVTSLSTLSGVGTGQITNGHKYTVTWNDTEYECRAFLMDDTDEDTVALGNAALLDMGTDTGEPFILADFTSSGCIVTKSTEDAETVAISINAEEEVVVHRIATKYLPASVPYVEEGGMQVILTDAECTPADDDGDGINETAMIPGTVTLTVGETYTVIWDGQEYECVGQDLYALTDGNVTGVGLGDYTSLGGSGSGEPFAVMWIPEMTGDTGYSGYLGTLDGSAVPSFSIGKAGATINKLDNRCLDLAWLPTNSKTGTVLLAKQSVKTGEIGIAFTESDLGKTIVVECDGTQYECVIQDDRGSSGTLAYSFGNYGIVGQTDTGEPFLVMGGPDSSSVVFTDSETHTFAIYGPGYNKLPEDFLPEYVVRVSVPVEGGFLRYVNGTWTTEVLTDVSEEGA